MISNTFYSKQKKFCKSKKWTFEVFRYLKTYVFSDQFSSPYFMALIDCMFCLDAPEIYKRKTLSVITVKCE